MKKVNLGMARFSGLYIWALLVVVFGIWTPNLFLSSATIHSVASAQAIMAMIAIAVVISMAAGAFDVSVGAVANLATITSIGLQTIYGWGMWSSIAVALAVGVVVGFVNGLMIVKFEVSPIVATLGMGSVLLATQTIVAKSGQPFPPTNSAWSELTQTTFLGGFQIVVLYMLGLAALAWWMMEQTPLGRYFYAIGGNKEAARLSGVNVDRWTWAALVISSTICAFAGVCYGSMSGPSLTYGGTLLLPAFAAAFLGSTQVTPGRFNILGTLIAVFVLATGVQGLLLVTGVQWINDMFSGLALVIAVAFAKWQQRRAVAGKRRFRAATARGPVAASRSYQGPDGPYGDGMSGAAGSGPPVEKVDQ